jgi:hypothetical protein
MVGGPNRVVHIMAMVLVVISAFLAWNLNPNLIPESLRVHLADALR